MTERFLKIDKGIFISALLMMGLGIVFVYSSSFAIAQDRFGGSFFFLARHIVRVAIALCCFVFFINFDYHILGKYSTIFYIFAVFLLVYALSIPDSEAVNGAKRWIKLGLFHIQVSEFARVILILSLAYQLEKKADNLHKIGIFIIQVIKIGVICLLVVLEPDFSTAVIIGLISFCLLFMAGAKITHLTSVLIPLIPLVVMSIVNSSYKLKRVVEYIDSLDNTKGVAYQTFQALVGLGNGGFFGTGLGLGEQKYFYLPEPHTDFVFSILGEEIGFSGLLIVISFFLILIFRGMRISYKAPDKMGQILALGLTLMVSCYFLLHSFVNTGIVPTTGVPLPFFSYGGMSLIFTMSSIGILLNISSQTRLKYTHLKNRRKS
jgi:cell division protein FtsW